MKTKKLSQTENFRNKKAGVMKKCKHLVKLFAFSYKQYLNTSGISFYSTWYGHPYGMR